VYHQREEADPTQPQTSFLLVFTPPHLSHIRKPPAALGINQGEVHVRLLGLVCESIEEALPSLVEPLRDLLGYLRVQCLEFWIPPSQIQSEPPKPGFTHRMLVSFILLLLSV
jgi:hypothetical protein